MNILACCNGVYTRRGFNPSYYSFSTVSTLRHPRDLLMPILGTALDIPYISILVIIALEHVLRKPRRNSYLLANYYEAFASHMLPSHIPIRIFRIDDSCKKLCVNSNEFTHCSNFLQLRLYTYISIFNGTLIYLDKHIYDLLKNAGLE